MEKAAGYVSAVLQTQRVTELAFISLNVWFLLVKLFFWLAFLPVFNARRYAKCWANKHGVKPVFQEAIFIIATIIKFRFQLKSPRQ